MWIAVNLASTQSTSLAVTKAMYWKPYILRAAKCGAWGILLWSRKLCTLM